MSLVVGILFILGALVLGALLWTSLVHDRVGRRERRRGEATGLQTQVAEWLRYDAAVAKPSLERLGAHTPEAPVNPADRALHAVVLREAVERNLALPKAHERLKERARSPLARAFLAGRMGRAVRIHWRSRYTGPPALFWPWFYAVATVRYGRRHMFLDTLSATLREFRTP